MARISKKGVVRQITAVPAERIWKTAVYARLSLEDSGRKGADTIDTQIELVYSYMTQRSYLSLTDTYIDNGVSGKDFERPAWQRLMDDIRAGRVDCVCVKDLSRFSRNYIETIEFLEKIFPFMGVRFVSVNDGYDNQTPGGKNEGLIIALKSLMHNQYLKDISRKTSSAIQTRRERGEYTGAFAPFGYKKSKSIKGRLEPDEATAPIVVDIFRWRADGISQMEICKRLDEAGVPCPSVRLREITNIKGEGYYRADIWQPKAVRQIIANPVYIGHLTYGKTRQSLAENKPLTTLPKSEWQIRKNVHEPTISLELWDAANAVEAAKNAEFYKNKRSIPLPENVFRSYLVCGFCGSKMVRSHNVKTNPSGKSYEYYHYYCALQRKHANEPKYKRVRLDVIYDVALTLVAQKLRSAENLRAVIEKKSKQQIDPRAALNAEITRISQELERLNNKQARLYEDYFDKRLTEMQFVGMKKIYEERAETFSQSITDLSRKAAVVTDVSVSDNRWLKAARDFQNPVELTQEMLEATVERIVVSGSEDIKVIWKFNDEFALLKNIGSSQNDKADTDCISGEESA